MCMYVCLSGKKCPLENADNIKTLAAALQGLIIIIGLISGFKNHLETAKSGVMRQYSSDD